MLKRLRRHLNPPTVIATIALFAALGGGYALAFSGSGSLQKAGIAQLPETFTDVRTLTGFGKLRAKCDPDDGTTVLRLHNSTDDLVQAVGEVDQVQVSMGAPAGGDSAEIPVAEGPIVSTARFHVFKSFVTAPDSKAQIDLMVAASGPNVADCASSGIRILALNTQQ